MQCSSFFPNSLHCQLSNRFLWAEQDALFEKGKSIGVYSDWLRVYITLIFNTGKRFFSHQEVAGGEKMISYSEATIGAIFPGMNQMGPLHPTWTELTNPDKLHAHSWKLNDCDFRNFRALGSALPSI